MYYFPKLQELERIMPAVLNAGMHARLAHARVDNARPAGAPQKVQPIKKCLQSVLVLIRRFVPAIIKVGILVQECTWVHRNPATGRYTHQVMHHALLLILLLRGDAHNPYVNTRFLPLVMWNDVHGGLPAAVFLEKRCECLLSCLSCITTKDKAARSVED